MYFISIDERIFYFTVDTKAEAEWYISRKRSTRPKNYSESARQKENHNRPRKQSEIAKIKEQIRIKVELITCQKRALQVLNKKNDKREVQQLDDSDVDEFDDLLDDDGLPTDEMPPTAEECTAGPSQHAMNDEGDDVVVLGNHIRPNIITEGFPKLEVDTNFSVQYGYTKDVSSFS